ncbi:hypothetical protein B8W72_17385 [Pseudomonas putida]|uniref:Uncharacterized protein n=1 Tax=Pseudomonas putida TaxID=303 RepID=A0A1Y3KXC7_PSEPU|nr:hypothetical protein B8W72_17385 [Pseudomonas putida]
MIFYGAETVLFPVPASSRVNPLPQDVHCPSGLCITCGSGFTREEAGTGKHLPAESRTIC